MRYDVNTSSGSDGRIISVIDEVDDHGIRVTLFRHVLNTQDVRVRVALEDLGWRHDGGIAAIDIPNTPSRCDSLGQGFQRVSAREVKQMMDQLAAIKAAFNK